MTWDESDLHYPQIKIDNNHVEGLSKWLEKIATMAPAYEGDWNVLIADIWPNDNYSRLIGHVQMSDVAIGYDTGYRVCAYLSQGGIVGDYGDDTDLIKQWLQDAASNPQTNKALSTLNQSNAFDIRLTSCGYGAIKSAPKVSF